MPASARSLATITPFTMPAMASERRERERASAMGVGGAGAVGERISRGVGAE
jgi:hypothetical protein